MDPFRKVKYNGLNNQGATCYLNSVLQVLFMTKDYRDAVKRHTSKNPDTQFIDRHLTALFDDLQKGRAYTYKITRMLGIHGVYEQRDAAEYFEKILSLTSPEASQIFHGQLTHKTICSSCGTEKDSHGAFWHLPLALVNPNNESYSVESGVKEYFKDADCSGENQMYCERCDDKSDATLKCLVKHHPEVLMLLLKRFEFNHSYMTYVKNNCTVEVPYTLKTPQNQTYELYAVVDHYGDLRSGFHTATIKSQDDGTWYTFNDTTVTQPDYQPFKVDQCERCGLCRSGVKQSKIRNQDARRKKTSRYHGLRNQGATCYLNSVLQVLFMTKDYRDAVKRHNSENPDTEFIDHHLSTLFDDLQDRISNTKEITCKLGIDTVYEQCDAAEYYEKILSLTNPDASQIFHGLLTHKTICSSCDDEEDSDAAFWHLPLALVDPHSESYSVENGIKEFFKDADFSGKRKMYCDQCDARSYAKIKCLVKHHPEVLMLLLKRFEFDFTYMTYVKNNCNVEVPYILEIPQNQTYELYAVVDHFGDLRRGHYTATIKSQDDGTWYTFDDTEISLNDCQPFQVDQSETSNSAYLLFYRKINEHADDTCNPNISETSSPENLPSATSDNNGQVEEESEEAEQVNNDITVSFSINGNEEAEAETEGLPPDTHSNVKSHNNKTSNSQENNEEKTDSSCNPHDVHTEVTMTDTDVRGNAETDDKTENRENLGTKDGVHTGGQEPQPDTHSDVESHNNKTSNSLETSKEKNESSYNPQDADPEITMTDTDVRRKAEADDEVNKREKLASKYLLEGRVEDQENDSEREKTPDTKLADSDEHVIQDHPNKQDEMNEEQRRVENVNTEKVEKNGNDEKSEKKEKSRTDYPDRDAKYQDKVTLSDIEVHTKENLGGSQEVKQHHDLQPGSMNKQGDQKVIEEADEIREIRGDDTDTQRKGPSESQHEYDQDGDQSNRSLDNTAQNKAEGKLSPTHTGHEGASVVRQTKEQQNEKDKDAQSEADSPHRQEGSAGSRGCAEIQEVGSIEGKRREDSPEHADDTCNPNISEMSYSEDLPSATSDNNDQVKEESEEAEQASNDITASFSINGNEETEAETEGLPPDTHSNVESHNNKTSNSQENNEERTDSNYNPQDADPETILHDKDIRGNVETDDAEKERENLSEENPPEERVEEQENDSEREKTPDTKLAVSDEHVIQDHPNKQDEMNEEQRRAEDVNTEKVEKNGNDEESEKKEKSGGDAENQDKVTLSDIEVHTKENLGGSQKVKQHHDLQPVSMNKRGDQTVIEEAEGISKIRADDTDRKRKGQTESQHEYDQDDDQSNRLGDTAQNKAEGKLSPTHAGHEGASVVRQTKEQQNEKDKDAQSEADSPHRQEGSAGSRGCAEIQEVGSIEGKRREDSPEHADDTCNPNISEMSYTEDLPSATSDNNDQVKEESEEAEQASNDITASFSINGNEETEAETEGLPPDTHSNVESYNNKTSNSQETNEEKTDSSCNPHDVHTEITMTDTDVRGNAETDDKTENRENLGTKDSVHTGGQEPQPDTHSDEESHNNKTSSQENNEEKTDSNYNPQDADPETILHDKDMRGNVETDDAEKEREKLSEENPPEGRVEEQENDSEREKTPDTKLAVSDEHVIQDHPNKQDEMNEEQRRAEDVNTEKVEKNGNDEESEKKEKSGTDHPDREAEYLRRQH